MIFILSLEMAESIEPVNDQRIINATANHALPHVGERGKLFMPYAEAYRKHIMYPFNGYCKTVIRFAAINAWRDRSRRRQKEIYGRFPVS